MRYPNKFIGVPYLAEALKYLKFNKKFHAFSSGALSYTKIEEKRTQARYRKMQAHTSTS